MSEEINETLMTAKAQLKAGWEMSNLPLDNNDVLWDNVKVDCGLSNPQLSSLKNEMILLRDKKNKNGKLKFYYYICVTLLYLLSNKIL